MAKTQALQTAAVTIDGARYTVDLRNPHDLAIALDFNDAQPRWFGAPPAHSAPLVSGEFTGRVQTGASCNCGTLTLTPHLDGTHTECAGHLTLEKLEARTVVPTGLLKALVVSVTPTAASHTAESSRPTPRANDLLITSAALSLAWPAEPVFAPQALIVRTLPNTPLKRVRDYRSEPAAFLSLPAASLLVARTPHRAGLRRSRPDP
jgi:hypothetical protein